MCLHFSIKAFKRHTEKTVLLRQQNEGQQMNFLLLQPKILLQQSNVLLIELKHFVVVTKYFCYLYILTNDFVGITKPFFLCIERERKVSSTL